MSWLFHDGQGDSLSFLSTLYSSKPHLSTISHMSLLFLNFVRFLGLVTSPLCSITVDGVTKSWQYGKTLIFDDSFLHGVEYKEASADEMRAILMVDIWQPDITVEEKQALRFMFGSD